MRRAQGGYGDLSPLPGIVEQIELIAQAGINVIICTWTPGAMDPRPDYSATYGTGIAQKDIDLFEINEGFAAQVIPSYRELGIPLDRLNVNGGGIAAGHPFGMTGARIATTLINSLRWHDKQFGLETMCVGGGQGMAMILERLS